jgi:hypothetical protein
MERDITNGLMEESTREPGSKIRWTEVENSFGPTAEGT